MTTLAVWANVDRRRIAKRLRDRARRALAPAGRWPFTINWTPVINHLAHTYPKDADGPWEIDHVFPLVAFDLHDPRQIRAAMAPENHKWMRSGENQSKGGHYNRHALVDYLKRKNAW